MARGPSRPDHGRHRARRDRLILQCGGAGVDKLRLTDGDYLTKAAILLFHRDPERFVPGAHVKIGYFRNEWDVRFHDVIAGGLFAQVSRAMEVLLNAVVHRDYAVPAPIQIRVHDECLRVFNPGSLPEGWTLEKLLGPHPSHPHNPDIAHAFFWAGDIETWGRGISRVIGACRRAGVPSPRIELEPNGLSFEFRFSDAYLESVAR